MRTARAEEVVVGKATGISGGEIGSAEATRAVIDAVKLRVVEDVETFRAEFEALTLPDMEVLEQAQVELGPLRIIQDVALRRTER